MYLGDLMEKAESGQFLVLSFLLQESQTTVKQAMEETGFSKATLTKYVVLLNDKAPIFRKCHKIPNFSLSSLPSAVFSPSIISRIDD